MIDKLVIGMAGSLALLAVVGLAYPNERERRTARLLTIDTPNGIVEEHYVYANTQLRQPADPMRG